MAGALIQFTKSGGLLPVTLGDDANKLTIELGEHSQECVVQKESLAGAPFPFQTPRGNNSGQFAFISTFSYPTLDAMTAALKTGLSLAGQQGSVVLTRGATTMTMANAILRSVKRANGSDGVKLRLSYVFEITTIT
jgi:hypothetical protein